MNYLQNNQKIKHPFRMKPTFNEIQGKLFEMRDKTVKSNPNHPFIVYFDEIYQYISELRSENIELGRSLAKIEKM